MRTRDDALLDSRVGHSIAVPATGYLVIDILYCTGSNSRRATIGLPMGAVSRSRFQYDLDREQRRSLVHYPPCLVP